MRLIDEFYYRVFGNFGGLLPLVFLFICVIVLGECLYFTVIAKKRREHGLVTGSKYLLLRWIFYLYLLFVYRQTGISGVFWTGQAIEVSRIYLIPFTTSPDPTPYILNVLMTIPLGIMLPFIWSTMRKWWKVTLTGLLLSFGIEFTQLFTWRVSATSDLIMNTLGALLGYLIFMIFFSWALRSDVTKTSTKIINNEAIFYLILSLVGAVVLYFPLF